MINLIIYFADDSERAESESIMRECRGDVLVLYNKLYYLLDFLTLNRLKTEFELAKHNNRALCVNNTVIVDNLQKDTIVREIKKIVKNNELINFSTINLQQFYQNAFQDLQDINNWKRIY